MYDFPENSRVHSLETSNVNRVTKVSALAYGDIKIYIILIIFAAKILFYIY